MSPREDISRREPEMIKRYAKRRLYNTATLSDVSLDDLTEMVFAGRPLVVYEAETGENITPAILAQLH
jgi:polyhydroxyalkanoate synthesis regulator protein